jgi:hypothetical protein
MGAESRARQVHVDRSHLRSSAFVGLENGCNIDQGLQQRKGIGVKSEFRSPVNLLPYVVRESSVRHLAVPSSDAGSVKDVF